MKKLFMILPLVLLLCFTFGCQKAEEVAEEPVVDVEAEKAAILAVDATFKEAMQAKDFDRAMTVFADDAVHQEDNDTFFINRDGIEKWVLRWFERELKPDWEVAKLVVSQSGDLAYALIKLDHTRINEDETVEHIRLGTFCVYKKHLDGSWKIVAFR
jgi:ketosteroid isomerase-like protein